MEMGEGSLASPWREAEISSISTFSKSISSFMIVALHCNCVMSFRTQLYPVGQPADPGRQAVYGHRFSREPVFQGPSPNRALSIVQGGKGKSPFSRNSTCWNCGSLSTTCPVSVCIRRLLQHRKGRPVHVLAVFQRRRKGAHRKMGRLIPDLVVHSGFTILPTIIPPSVVVILISFPALAASNSFLPYSGLGMISFTLLLINSRTETPCSAESQNDP